MLFYCVKAASTEIKLAINPEFQQIKSNMDIVDPNFEEQFKTRCEKLNSTLASLEKRVGLIEQQQSPQ